MKIIDRYLFKELLHPFLFGIFAFTLILSGSTILFPIIGEALRYNISLPYIILLIVYKLPGIIVFTFPMSMLLSTLLAFARLSQDSEIIAFRASGIGLKRLVLPAIYFGLIASFITIGFNEYIVPRATHNADLLLRSLQHEQNRTIKRNINVTEYDEQTGLPKRILNVLKIKHDILYNITMAEYDNGVLSRIMKAEEGQWFPGVGWEFRKGRMHSFPENQPKRLSIIEFQKEKIKLPFKPQELSPDKKTSAEAMNVLELRKHIQFLSKTGVDTTKDRVDLHLKFSVPFASLIFAILGVSVGLRPHRSSSSVGLGISIIIIFIYYILLTLGVSLGKSNILPPLIAAWMSNVVIGISGILLLQRLIKQ